LCERWTLILVREFFAGSTRFSDLQKGVPLMSPTLLSSRLKHLIKSGVVSRNGSKGNHTYHLTQAGRELQPVIELLGTWGHRWAQSDLNDGDLDAGLLMWDIRRTVDPAIFPTHRIVVHFNYPDAPTGAGNWWLISDDGEVDLCLKDPGHDVDILIKCSLKAMTQIWICEKTFKESVASGDITIMGDPKLTGRLQDWLRSSPLAKLGSLDISPTLHWNNS
jgi:DNA-binding HxlR family transcriptional regulator